MNRAPVMKRLLLMIVGIAFLASSAIAQGTFLFSNRTAPTRLGSIDGPLAGPGIWAAMLVGQSPETLVQIGPELEHAANGLIRGAAVITVPGVFPGMSAYIQMAAWDGTVWGTSYSAVPPNQVGRTDTVLHVLAGTSGGLPPIEPGFTRPAVVPPVPEPSAWLLAMLGGCWASTRRPGPHRRGAFADC